MFINELAGFTSKQWCNKHWFVASDIWDSAYINARRKGDRLKKVWIILWNTDKKLMSISSLKMPYNEFLRTPNDSRKKMLHKLFTNFKNKTNNWEVKEYETKGW